MPPEVIKMTSVGDKLRDLRVAHRFSQTYIAQRLGLSQGAVSAFENGRNEPNFATIEQLARIYNVSPLSLMPFENDTNESRAIEIASAISRSPKLYQIFQSAQFLPDSSLDAVLSVINALTSKETDHE